MTEEWHSVASFGVKARGSIVLPAMQFRDLPSARYAEWLSRKGEGFAEVPKVPCELEEIFIDPKRFSATSSNRSV